MDKETVKIYRYVRPESDDSCSPHNLGGVCFAFEFDNPGDELRFGYSICYDDENFEFETAKTIADHQPKTVIPYNRSRSLVTNVCDYLDDKDQDPNQSLTAREKTLMNKLMDYGL